MNVCPAVCTTTYEIVLNPTVMVSVIIFVVTVVLITLKKIKLWQGLLVTAIVLLFTFLVAVKINTCDSGCAKNGSIKFENVLFGDKD